MAKKERFLLGTAIFFQITIGVLVPLAAIIRSWSYMIAVLVSLGFTFLPAILSKKGNIHLPPSLIFLISFSLWLHAAGLVHGWYINYMPIYDKIGHFFGSATVALLGLTLTITINNHSKLCLEKRHIVFFIIVFTLALGAFWEIIEFIIDQIYGTLNQPSLTDTMVDLIVDFLTGIAVAVLVNINYVAWNKDILDLQKRK